MRSQFAFQIARGGTTIGKVQRYLRASGLDAPVFATEAARQRHIHPRTLRAQVLSAPVPQAALASVERSMDKAGENTSAFASFGKKPDAPAS